MKERYYKEQCISITGGWGYLNNIWNIQQLMTWKLFWMSFVSMIKGQSNKNVICISTTLLYEFFPHWKTTDSKVFGHGFVCQVETQTPQFPVTLCQSIRDKAIDRHVTVSPALHVVSLICARSLSYSQHGRGRGKTKHLPKGRNTCVTFVSGGWKFVTRIRECENKWDRLCCRLAPDLKKKKLCKTFHYSATFLTGSHNNKNRC